MEKEENGRELGSIQREKGGGAAALTTQNPSLD
jgi:hypothetical protein